MNSGMHTESRQEAAPAPGAAVDDVLYTLFRHKWLILSFILFGCAAAVVVRFLKPPLYQSEAKISVKYVMQTTGVNPSDTGTQVTALGFGGQEVMDAEVEIIRSLDTALIVATNIGPAKILAEKGGGNHPLVAASVVREGLTVPPPRSATLALTFKHPDPTVVQPVLDALIKAYMRRHAEMRTGRGMEEVFAQERDELGRKIAQMDVELKKLKLEAGVPDLEESKRAYQRHIAKLQDDFFEAQSKLAQREALYGEWLADSTNSAALVVPLDQADEYRQTVQRVEQLKKEVSAKLEEFTPLHPDVVRRKDKIAQLTQRLAELEKANPSIASLGVSLGIVGTGTNETTINISSSLGDIKLLKRTVDGYSNQLAIVKAEAFRLMDFERQITELERKRTAVQKNYEAIQSNLDQARQDDSKGSGRVTGMYLTESPTPAGPDVKKLLKMVGMAFGGCVGMGIGLAFLIDLILDRTIRRRQDVVRHLHLPVFLTIPDTNWKNRIHFPWLITNGNAKPPASKEAEDEPLASAPSMALAEWNPTNHLQSHVEGLRERLITHFEVNNINHKPKLVAVTSCNHGAGVTTLSGGLAAALSKTGDGSALLVDMNTADGKTHSFYKGKPGCGPSEILENEPNSEESFRSGLPLATVSPEQRKQDRLAKLLPPSFNHLVPKLKATEYDYIVFDMPRVSARSVTARLCGQMDIVLMVIESERTGQQRAGRAMALMREARATVAAVLNKCRNYVPARLAND
jgi:polysaccharide biosynthesis transport protein